MRCLPWQRINAKVELQKPVQFGVLNSHFMRQFEKRFAGYGKKLCSTGGSVVVQQRRGPMGIVGLQPVILAIDYFLPLPGQMLVVKIDLPSHFSIQTI